MTAKDRTTDVKHELAHGLEKLATLRDEAKLHLHLATLDAKQEWDERLDPTIAELQATAQQLGEASKDKVQELVKNVEDFVTKLRSRSSS
jgi:hypothetical protein